MTPASSLASLITVSFIVSLPSWWPPCGFHHPFLSNDNITFSPSKEKTKGVTKSLLFNLENSGIKVVLASLSLESIKCIGNSYFIYLIINHIDVYNSFMDYKAQWFPLSEIKPEHLAIKVTQVYV